jgi:hypothetical protein
MLCGAVQIGSFSIRAGGLMRKQLLSTLRLRRRTAWSAGVVAVLAATQSLAAPMCTPDLAITGAHLSDMRASQRIWTARIAVDASQCAVTSGRFFIRFVRLKEIGPDLSFAEAFTWRPGVIDVLTVFAADEAVLDAAIGYVRPCACREIGAR